MHDEQRARAEVERLRERLARVEAYARACAVMRVEPNTRGLKDALAPAATGEEERDGV